MEVLNIVFFSTEPSGYSHRRRYTGNVDDLTGCLAGQTAGKALFSQQKVTTASRSPTRAVVAFSNNVLVRS